MIRRAAVLLALVLCTAAFADEGQWPPEQLKDLDWNALAARGLTLSAKDLWDANGGGLTQAIVNFEGCSASFVSADGLIVSNHHCVYDAVQQHSTPEHDYLANGFLARTRDAELRATGQRVQVLQSVEDVTLEIAPRVAAASDDVTRTKVLERAQKELVAECEKKPATRCRVASYYGGLRYVLLASLELRDVRLVYAPPASVGDFGGEVDNFAWPRHTGDFSFVRAYVAPDGSAADYAPQNVPFKPKRFLALSSRGIRPGELVMVLGYPGRTQRYLPASGVLRDEEWYYPERERLTREWKSALERASAGDHEAELRAAASIKSIANTLKNAEGMIAGFKRNGVLASRREADRGLAAFVEADPARKVRYGAVLAELDAVYTRDAATRTKDLLVRMIQRASVPLGGALTDLRWARERARPDLDREEGFQDRDRGRVKAALEKSQKDYHPRIDRAGLRYFLQRLLDLPAAESVPGLAAALGVEGASGTARDAKLDAYLDAFYAKTALATAEGRLARFDRERAALDADADPALALARALEPERDAAERREKELAGALVRLRPRYSELLIAYRRTAVYPDANSTLRIAFATVKGYSPKNGVLATPQTTLPGMLAKHTGAWPFDVPQRVRETAARRAFGRYVQDDLGAVPVDFLSDADTTGGNSGSPVLNGKGELVGLNFDRVFENVAGDYGWNASYSRNISVDVRYVLWMLEDVDHAAELLHELGL